MLKVALNPNNSDSASFYDSVTEVNLFLDSPISDDIGDKDLTNITYALESGTLIVWEGEVPKGTELPKFAVTRSRWVEQQELPKKWGKSKNKEG